MAWLDKEGDKFLLSAKVSISLLEFRPLNLESLSYGWVGEWVAPLILLISMNNIQSEKRKD